MLALIGSWPGAQWLREDSTAYIFVNAAHIVSIGLLIGTILVLDLRIIGIAGRWRLGEAGAALSRAALTGVICAAITGAWLFSVRPELYLENPAFLTKLALLAIAVANALLLHLGPRWRQALSTGRPVPLLRIQAGFSLILWLGVVLAGRWIGFI